MSLRNSNSHYGWAAIVLHWLIAILTLSLFSLGIWMVDLDYYDQWYNLAPWWHKSLGSLLLVLLISRFIWNRFNPKPALISDSASWKSAAAHFVHKTMDILILLICLSGYLVVTASGKPLVVFDVIEIPSLVNSYDNLEDMAGEVHEILAYALMGLVGLHVLAALQHHFFYKDQTLKRMFGINKEIK